MPDEETKSKNELRDKLAKIAQQQLITSNDFKKPLLEKWAKFDELEAGITKKKLRIQFNVVLPVFAGMLDTLAADFDEPIEMEFKQKHPSDYFKAQKIQAAWNLRKNSTDKDAKWDYKARMDKKNNIRYGRSILKYYAESDPKYHDVLEVVDPKYFHCQPTGGGQLENHLFVGQEGIMRTEAELKKGAKAGYYDEEQVKKLIEESGKSDYETSVTDQVQQKLSRFKVLGLNTENNTYIGEKTFNLCEWGLTYEGVRYSILFDAWTGIAIRCEELKELFSLNLWQFTSWACFEDDKVFWSQGYSDIIYPIADSIITLFNQELSNREKLNYGARAYDKDMFTDVAKLDAAQYRADALVPVDTKGGTRAIASAIYRFDTAQLQGTVDLIDWMDASLQKSSGVSDISQGSAMQASKKVNIAYIEQAQVAKRIGLKSQSYTECWEEIGTRFVQGLQDHLTQDMAIEILGDSGIEPDVLSRKDLKLKKQLGVNVISSTQKKAEAAKKKQGKIDTLKLLIQDQNINSEWRTAALLRDAGNYSEDEIKLALDTKNYAARESVAKAHIVIQELLTGEEPEINYAADTTFLQVIMDYMMEHRNKIGKTKFKLFAEYLTKHAGLALMNGKRKGAMRGQQAGKTAVANGTAQPAQGGQGQSQPQPQPQGAGQPMVGGQQVPQSAPAPEQMQTQ